MIDRLTFLGEYYFRLMCTYAFDLCNLITKKTSQILQVKRLSGPFQYIKIFIQFINSDHVTLHIFDYPKYNTIKQSQ